MSGCGSCLLLILAILLSLSSSAFAQEKRLWVLRASGEMVEYDLPTFAAKQTVKVPPEAVKAPGNLSVNRMGQMLFEPPVTLPLSEEDAAAGHKIWVWNGHTAVTLNQGVERKVENRGSNQAVTESAPLAYLSADGNHLVWFTNQARRLQREEIDLSITTTWQAWRTDLAGGGREELISEKLPDCRCTTGTCEDSCPTGVAWVPEGGVDRLFLMTQFVAGQTAPTYKSSTKYLWDAGKWTGAAPASPLQRLLDADSSGNVLVEAIPDTGCCGWSNQSDDQTLVLVNGKAQVVFDEKETYKNSDYDVSFYTSNAKLSPDAGYVAMTISATAQANKAIQLAQDGQANPEESARIRKALAELPAAEVKSVETPHRVAYVPHAALVGWISEKEVLIVEDHALVVYTVGSGARRKSSVRVEDGGKVFLR